jgi:hypothetical protein
VLDAEQQPILWAETLTLRSCWTIAPSDHRQETTSIRLRTRTSAHMIMTANPFWNAPFGALRDAGDFSSADDLAALWREVRVLLRGGLAGDSIAIAGLE